jgi:hypothetical protein
MEKGGCGEAIAFNICFCVLSGVYVCVCAGLLAEFLDQLLDITWTLRGGRERRDAATALNVMHID